MASRIVSYAPSSEKDGNRNEKKKARSLEHQNYRGKILFKKVT